MEPHLTRFEGLSELERKEQTSKIGHTYVYESADDAFDAACEAFRNVEGLRQMNETVTERQRS